LNPSTTTIRFALERTLESIVVSMTSFEGMTEEDQLNTLMAELKDSNIRQSVMEYIAQKSESSVGGVTDKQRLSKMIETIAAESLTSQKQSDMWKSRTKKSIVLGMAAVIVAVTIQFLVNFFSNELSKESHVSGKGTMVGTDGSVVKTEMNEMRVNADGQLQGRNSVKTIKTTPSLNQIALASSLPDSTLLALDEVTVYSDKGHTLRVKVMGFARVPVLNSRCGNLVHFYSAQGRISLDSTDISFDKNTESQFKDAGFTLAVGGYGGRRLADLTTAQGFFKHVDKLRKSGAWTCADVALPAVQATSMSRSSEYHPCVGHGCYSSYGGLKLGVAKLAEAHAVAALPVTSRIRALLKASATEAYYMRTEMTTLMSPGYTLSIHAWDTHFGQEKIRLLSHKTLEETVFQSEIGVQNIYHCSSGKDVSGKVWRNTLEDEKDQAVQVEFVGLTEEGGVVLRHWRWWLATVAAKRVGGSPNHKALGELWDFADTMVPYRSLTTEGILAVYESYSSKCTDADVSEALSLRTTAPIESIMACKAETTLAWPLMTEVMDDVSEEDIPHYLHEIFGGLDATRAKAIAGDDRMSKIADYLTRGELGYTMGSVHDPCYLACKEAIDAHAVKYDCRSKLAALACLQSSYAECHKGSHWVSQHEGGCGKDEDTATDLERSLEEVPEDKASVLVPASPTGAVDLTRASPTFQAALARTRGPRSPKMTLNVTRRLMQAPGSTGKMTMTTFRDPNGPLGYQDISKARQSRPKYRPAGSQNKLWGGSSCSTCSPGAWAKGTASPPDAKKAKKTLCPFHPNKGSVSKKWPNKAFTGRWKKKRSNKVGTSSPGVAPVSSKITPVALDANGRVFSKKHTTNNKNPMGTVKGVAAQRAINNQGDKILGTFKWMSGANNSMTPKSCPTCRWGPCMFQFGQIPLLGLMQGLGAVLCLNFSFCITQKVSLVLMFKFDIIEGWFCFSLILNICVNFPVFNLPDPPLTVSICLSGNMQVQFTLRCATIGLTGIIGSGSLSCHIYFSISVFAGIVSICEPLAGITIKVEGGHKYTTYEDWCWEGVLGDNVARRRRRAWWDWGWRRRYDRRCNYKQQCDSFWQIDVEIVLLVFFKFKFVHKKWVTTTESIGNFYIQIKWAKDGVQIWDIGFWPIFGFECYRQYEDAQKMGNPSPSPNTGGAWGYAQTGWSGRFTGSSYSDWGNSPATSWRRLKESPKQSQGRRLWQWWNKACDTDNDDTYSTCIGTYITELTRECAENECPDPLDDMDDQQQDYYRQVTAAFVIVDNCENNECADEVVNTADWVEYGTWGTATEVTTYNKGKPTQYQNVNTEVSFYHAEYPEIGRGDDWTEQWPSKAAIQNIYHDQDGAPLPPPRERIGRAPDGPWLIPGDYIYSEDEFLENAVMGLSAKYAILASLEWTHMYCEGHEEFKNWGDDMPGNCWQTLDWYALNVNRYMILRMLAFYNGRIGFCDDMNNGVHTWDDYLPVDLWTHHYAFGPDSTDGPKAVGSGVMESASEGMWVMSEEKIWTIETAYVVAQQHFADLMARHCDGDLLMTTKHKLVAWGQAADRQEEIFLRWGYWKFVSECYHHTSSGHSIFMSLTGKMDWSWYMNDDCSWNDLYVPIKQEGSFQPIGPGQYGIYRSHLGGSMYSAGTGPDPYMSHLWRQYHPILTYSGTPLAGAKWTNNMKTLVCGDYRGPYWEESQFNLIFVEENYVVLSEENNGKDGLRAGGNPEVSKDKLDEYRAYYPEGASISDVEGFAFDSNPTYDANGNVATQGDYLTSCDSNNADDCARTAETQFANNNAVHPDNDDWCSWCGSCPKTPDGRCCTGPLGTNPCTEDVVDSNVDDKFFDAGERLNANSIYGWGNDEEEGAAPTQWAEDEGETAPVSEASASDFILDNGGVTDNLGVTWSPKGRGEGEPCDARNQADRENCLDPNYDITAADITAALDAEKAGRNPSGNGEIHAWNMIKNKRMAYNIWIQQKWKDWSFEGYKYAGNSGKNIYTTCGWKNCRMNCRRNWGGQYCTYKARPLGWLPEDMSGAPAHYPTQAELDAQVNFVQDANVLMEGDKEVVAPKIAAVTNAAPTEKLEKAKPTTPTQGSGWQGGWRYTGDPRHWYAKYDPSSKGAAYDKVRENQELKDKISEKGHYDLKGKPLKLTKGAGGKDMEVRSSKDMVAEEKRKEKAREKMNMYA